MHDIAAAVEEWLAGGEPVVVVRVVERSGIGAGGGSALAVTAGGAQVGDVLGGAAAAIVDELVADVLATGSSVAEAAALVDGAVATACGLTCGGVARLVAQRADAFDADTWSRLALRHAVAVATRTDGGSAGATRVTGGLGPPSGTLDDEALDALVTVEGRTLLARGAPATARVATAYGAAAVVEAFVPATALVVVGDGPVGAALAAQSALLGWRATVVDGVADGLGALGGLGAGDAVVVLSHAGTVDAPVLAAALAAPVGFVGAMGSRRTQEARRARLVALDVAPELIDRLHAPVGLDLGATTAAGIALSICAEVIAAHSERSGGALRETRPPSIRAH